MIYSVKIYKDNTDECPLIENKTISNFLDDKIYESQTNLTYKLTQNKTFMTPFYIDYINYKYRTVRFEMWTHKLLIKLFTGCD